MPISTRLPLPILALIPVLLSPPASAEEPPADCRRSGDALRIEYQVENQIKERHYREQDAPLDVRVILNLFRVGRHLVNSANHRALRGRFFRAWRQAACVC